MSTDRWIRASDQDREKVIGVLCDAYAVGRVSREEFDERSTAAYSARTWGELRDLTADLPAPRAGGLPADAVAGRDVTRRTGAPIMRLCLFVVAAGLAFAGFAGAVWVIAFVPMVSILIFVARDAPKAGSQRRGSR
jgi:hypothetical protein